MNGESIVEELLLLLEMDRLETSGDGSAGSATGVQNVTAVVVLGLVQQSLDTGLGVAPGTGVQRLLLGPDDVAGVGVAVQVLLQLSPREGVQLLNTGDGGVADAVGFTVLGKSSVDLSRAEDDALDLLGLVDLLAVGGVGDDPLEVRVAGEALDVRASKRVTEQGLREEDHEGWHKS